jgi:single-stranded DNA-binding protein
MANVVVISGKIIKLEYKEAEGNRDALIQIIISAPTGRKKKEDEQYPPTDLIKTTVWGNLAVTYSDLLYEGLHVTIEGKHDKPEAYITADGEAKATSVVHSASVSFDPSVVFKEKEEETTKKTAKASTKSTTSSKTNTTAKKAKSKNVAVVLEEDDEDVSFLDEETDLFED